MLDLENKRGDLHKLMALAGTGFPTLIPRTKVIESLSPEVIRWFVDRDILALPPPGSAQYGLVDEFLRIRLMLDEEQSEQGKRELESKIIDGVSVEEFAEAELGTDRDGAVDYEYVEDGERQAIDPEDSEDQ
jgi:hypothetical protein